MDIIPSFLYSESHWDKKEKKNLIRLYGYKPPVHQGELPKGTPHQSSHQDSVSLPLFPLLPCSGLKRNSIGSKDCWVICLITFTTGSSAALNSKSGVGKLFL